MRLSINGTLNGCFGTPRFTHANSALNSVLNRPLWGWLNMDADQRIDTDGEILTGSAFDAVLNARMVARGLSSIGLAAAVGLE